jgi:predicted RNA-binding protein with PIN domain
MRFLIDGYNLLHAMGVLHGRLGPSGLGRARLRLLALLRNTYGPAAATVTVVFDAADPPPDLPAEQHHHGIQVLFAVSQDEADDLLELLIRKASTPKNVTVVSDDRRVQQAARRRKCLAMRCHDFLDSLARERRPQGNSAVDPPVKPSAPSINETDQWLTEFAELGEDPKWKELFEPPGLPEDEE